MGNCFSDPSKPPGKGQTLGSTPSHPAQSSSTTTAPPTSAAGRPAKQRINSPPPQTLGSPGAGGDAGDPRGRALQAAEERAKAVSSSFNHLLLASGCIMGMENEADYIYAYGVGSRKRCECIQSQGRTVIGQVGPREKGREWARGGK